MTELLNHALDYAKRGWYVFPCRERPGASFIRNGETVTPYEKQPYTSNGLNDATIDEDQIISWWSRFPNALIGVNAGKSGLFVIDIDKKHVNGLDTFSSWNINDIAGLHSITPSGGTHIVFSGTGKSSTNANTGIDTRGEGGYFIAPPSKIVEGKYTGEYKFFDDWSRKPGIIPDGLMSKLFPDRTIEYVHGNTKSNGIKQLSRSSLNFLVDGAKEGERNSTLFKVLADFAGCGYTKEQAKETVRPVCIRIGLGDSEIEQVLHNVYSEHRTPTIPESLQEKLSSGGKHLATSITTEEHSFIESAILACLLVDNSFISAISDILNFEDFRLFKNRAIFKTIIRLYNTGMKVDYLTVSNEISKETDKVTLDDIAKIINQYFVNTDNIFTYASIVKEKASIRKIEAIMDNKEKYLEAKSFSEMVANLEKDISDVAIYGGARSTNILTSTQATDMFTDRANKMSKGEIGQLPIGFSSYDYYIGGLYTNELVICAGRAGEGKSALSLSIANNIAIKQGKPVLFFSLEMSTQETICRLVCQLTGLPFRKVFQGKLDGDSEWAMYREAIEKINKAPLYFDDSFGMNIFDIRSKIRKLGEKDISLVIIDQLEQIRGYEGQPEYIRYDKIAYDIKNFTKEFNVPIILNHQLNRGITDRKLKNPEPQLSDLNQAGEKPADQVWVISHKKDEQQKKILDTEIKILKNRNGIKLRFRVLFVGERMLFADIANDNPSYSEIEENTNNDISDPDWI